MKKIIVIATIAIIAAAFTTQAWAKDKLIETEVQKVYFKTDKNGDEYARLIVSEKRKLNGIEYPASVLLMAFSDTVSLVENISAGDKIKAIVSESTYQGNKNYRLVHVIK